MGQLPVEDGGGKGGGAGGGCGAGGGGVVDPMDTAHKYDERSVIAFCELLAVLLRRWGTGACAANPVMQVR